MLHAITRPPSASIADCELSFVGRETIDLQRARAQHQDYQQALIELGCQLCELPAQDDLPDAVFVEDVALVLDELAIITRPGAAARRLESSTVEKALTAWRSIQRIEAPATIDGGDVLRVGRRIFVGLSERSNAAAVAQLQELLSDYGYSVQGVPIRDCLHLKSSVTEVADGILLVNPAWVDPNAFAGFQIIGIDPSEEHAANALRVGKGLIYPDCFPRTQAKLAAAGIAVRNVDVSELQKAEGAVTCCSLVFSIP